jgi:putative ABC transport system substrate-binding protein
MPVFFWRALVATTSVAAALAASAAPAHRLLHVCDCSASMASAERAELLAELGKLGYVQGRNLDLVSRDLTAGRDSYEAYMRAAISARRPELILASGIRVAQAAKVATQDVPVVFWRLTDPIGNGLVDSLAHPQGNLTGFSRAIEKLTQKRLELLHEMLPQARRIGFVYVVDNASHRRQAAEVKAAAASLRIELVDYGSPLIEWSDASLDATFARMRSDRIDAFLLPDINYHAPTLVALASKYRLPTIYSLTHVVTDWGGLAAYATEAGGFDEIASYADRILKGARPGDLPVQEPLRFELVLNARAARAIGVAFPPVFMLRASAVVEK